MSTEKLFAALFAVVVVVGAIYFLSPASQDGSGVSATSTPRMVNYTSEAMGVSFSYPDTYIVDEKDVSTPERSRHSIVLIRTDDLPLPQNGEGPTAITIDAFQNDLESLDSRTWITGTNDSNYKLSPDGTISTGTLAGLSALSFRWSGLYEGRTTVVAEPAFVYALSVTYLTPEDEILDDFDALLKTVRFTQ
ncbi:MAG: hypothetical protein HYS26_02020 [Candidatus Kaiserbacteria bacterium]|nr:MAG: hypothetical protein HYS26_02020 [Candidatus Kaiserbacteria bacterium]